MFASLLDFIVSHGGKHIIYKDQNPNIHPWSQLYFILRDSVCAIIFYESQTKGCIKCTEYPICFILSEILLITITV